MTTKTKGLRITTPCATVDQFIAAFHRFCEESSFFISTLSLRPIGIETAFSVDLSNGQSMLRGFGVILDAWPTAANRFGRPGVRIGVHELTTDTKSIFEQLMIAKAIAQSQPPAQRNSTRQLWAIDLPQIPGVVPTVDTAVPVVADDAPATVPNLVPPVYEEPRVAKARMIQTPRSIPIIKPKVDPVPIAPTPLPSIVHKASSPRIEDAPKASVVEPPIAKAPPRLTPPPIAAEPPPRPRITPSRIAAEPPPRITPSPIAAEPAPPIPAAPIVAEEPPTIVTEQSSTRAATISGVAPPTEPPSSATPPVMPPRRPTPIPRPPIVPLPQPVPLAAVPHDADEVHEPDEPIEPKRPMAPRRSRWPLVAGVFAVFVVGIGVGAVGGIWFEQARALEESASPPVAITVSPSTIVPIDAMPAVISIDATAAVAAVSVDAAAVPAAVVDASPAEVLDAAPAVVAEDPPAETPKPPPHVAKPPPRSYVRPHPRPPVPNPAKAKCEGLSCI